MRKILITIAAMGLVASACGTDNPLTGELNGATPITSRAAATKPVVIRFGDQQIVLTSSLSGFGSCDALLEHLRTTGAEHVGPYGFDSGNWYGGPTPLAADGVAAPAREVAGTDTNLVEGIDFSGTNIQETGVDEADIVKTDGRRIYIVSRGQLVVIDVAGRKVIGKIDVTAGSAAELFVSGNEILYITSSRPGGPHPYEAGFEGGISVGGNGGNLPVPRIAVGEPDPNNTYSPVTTIVRISVAADGTPAILESLVVAGDYMSSRAIDGTARIVLRSDPQNRFPFVYPAGPAGEKRAEKSNRQALLDSQLGDWLPSYTLVDGNGREVSSGLLPDCNRTEAPTEFSGLGVVSILTLAIDGPIDPSNTSAVLAPGETVYASRDSLYVTTTRWLDNIEVADGTQRQKVSDARRTSIHRFDISSASGAAYVASGSVPGDVRDRFSLSEFDGYLRVVSSTGQAWDNSSQTTLHVLKLTPNSLDEVGSVGDMGNGEAVQSVRFDGATGYVVTFRQVDPFYTLDISDPTDPRLVGELRIPGFSSYLHPIGNGMVIGVGTATDRGGRTTGAKVSLFDVTDLANPREVATWVSPDGWNDVGWDARSFLWWEAGDVAVVPVTLRSRNWSGAVVLKITDGRITEMGRIDHVDPNETPGRSDCPEPEPAAILPLGRSDSEQWYQSGATGVGINLAEDQHFEVCRAGGSVHQISGTMMLPGGELWSMSTMYGDLSGRQAARLQANDLVSLDRLAVLDL